MKLLIPHSKEWRIANKLPTIQHELFFDLLFISPSYQLVHRIKSGQSKLTADLKKIIDFDKVLELYDIVGNLYETTFDDWWMDKGQLIFFDDQTQHPISFNIDLSKSMSTLQKEFLALIDSEKKKLSSTKKITFITNKVREASLSPRISLVHDLANKRDKSPHYEYWRLAIFSGFQSKYTIGLKLDSKANTLNITKRIKLTELITKALKDAFDFSENAARGRFPSNTPVSSGLSFNLPFIYEQDKLYFQRTRLKKTEKNPIGIDVLTQSQWKTVRKKAKGKNTVKVESLDQKSEKPMNTVASPKKISQ